MDYLFLSLDASATTRIAEPDGDHDSAHAPHNELLCTSAPVSSEPSRGTVTGCLRSVRPRSAYGRAHSNRVAIRRRELGLCLCLVRGAAGAARRGAREPRGSRGCRDDKGKALAAQGVPLHGGSPPQVPRPALELGEAPELTTKRKPSSGCRPSQEVERPPGSAGPQPRA
eukprot:GHVT01101512.1.p1 GENE.GHVT01101512.1~~GHVT01101512.1.p1  ORF type:complete len:170 (+),score=15.19 GHVT01101512.1:351-860(+)